MLRSMTGFGRGEAQGAQVQIEVEIRSVNQRFADVNTRLPAEYAGLEGAVVQAVKARVSRGKLDVAVRRATTRSDSQVRADKALFDAYLGALDPLLEGRSDAERAQAVSFALTQPGVVQVTAGAVDLTPETPVLLEAVAQALDALCAMRAREGAELRADLAAHLDQIETHVGAVEAVVEDLDARQRARIEARMTRLLEREPEAWRVAQEAALLADKADVSEELSRLRSHLLQLRESLEADEPVGRRLGFLLQEVNREVNTLGSKTVDHDVSARVVEMKTLLERLREQAANVE